MKIKRTKLKFINEDDEKMFTSTKEKSELEISYQLKRIADLLMTIVKEA